MLFLFLNNSLIRLNQVQQIFEAFLKEYTESTDSNKKYRILTFFFKYFKEKQTYITLIPIPTLYEYFRTLIVNVNSLFSLSDYEAYSDVLQILLSSLTSYSSTNLYSSILSFDSQNWAIALFALSLRDQDYIGNCISNIK